MSTDAYVTYDGDSAQADPFLRCANCNADLCTVEEGDHLSILLGVLSDHAEDECPGGPQ